MFSMIKQLLTSMILGNWVVGRDTNSDLQSYFNSEYKSCAPAAYDYFRTTGNINYPG